MSCKNCGDKGCNSCERVVINRQGERGPQGPPGIQGPRGNDGTPGSAGTPGENGLDGRIILAAYNSSDGIGNDSPIGTTNVFSHIIPANTLSANGEELEVFIYTDYNDNDPVDMDIKLSATDKYTYTIQNSNSDLRFIKVRIARISQTSQLWTFEAVRKDVLGKVIDELDAIVTAFDLATPSTFEIDLTNSAIGASQVVLRKCVLYYSKI